MGYLININTKEHDQFGPEWVVVEADSEGWIKHEGNECPLPDDVKCKLMLRCGRQWLSSKPQASKWSEIIYYRPILEQAEPVQEPELPQHDVADDMTDWRRGSDGKQTYER